MRYLVFTLITILSAYGFMPGDRIQEDLSEHFDRIAPAMKNINASSSEEVKQVSETLKKLLFTVNIEIQKIPSNNLAEPSVERLAEIEKWASQIKPYNKLLLDASFNTNRDNSISEISYESQRLLDYTDLDNDSIAYLKNRLSETSSMGETRKVVSILSEHRQLTQDEKDIIINSGDKYTGKAKIIWAKRVASWGAIEGINELLPLIQNSVDPNNPDKSVREMQPALHLLPIAGKYSKEFAEAFYARYAELEDLGMIERWGIDQTKNYFEGRKELPRLIAKNGSGYLDAEVKSYPLLIEGEKRPKKSPPSKDEVEELRKQEERESSPEADKPNSFPWWLLGIVGLIVVLGLLLLKGRSK